MHLVEGATQIRGWVRNTRNSDAWDLATSARLAYLTDTFAHERRVIDTAFTGNRKISLAQMLGKF